ncbi:MAG: hypothetical protein ACD_48C00203G0001, partial [uncultured bacterium]
MEKKNIRKGKIYRTVDCLTTYFLNIVLVATILLFVFLSVPVVTGWTSFGHIAFAQESLTHGPIIGGVTDTSAVVWARIFLPQGSNLTVRYGTDSSSVMKSGIPAVGVQSSQFREVQYITNANNPWDYTWKATVTGLQSDITYYYAVFNGDNTIQLSPATFKTFPQPYSDVQFNFLYITDLIRVTKGYNTFRTIDNSLQNFAFALLGGDLWHRTVTNFSKNESEFILNLRNEFTTEYSLSDGQYRYFHSLLSKLPLVHFYDDHDMGLNDLDGTFKWKGDSLSILKEYFPVYQEETMNNGFWQKFTYGNADFFVLDVRSQRSPIAALDNGQKTMLGDEQFAWLKQGLKASKAKWKFLISGLVFNPTH